jgi:hypothetical protein
MNPALFRNVELQLWARWENSDIPRVLREWWTFDFGDGYLEPLEWMGALHLGSLGYLQASTGTGELGRTGNAQEPLGAFEDPLVTPE